LGKDQQGKSEKTLRSYNYGLGFSLDFTAQQNLRFLDQIDRNQLLRYVKFLREHDSDLDDRTVHNIFEILNTFLRTRDILIAGKIPAELDYAEKPPKPYTKNRCPRIRRANFSHVEIKIEKQGQKLQAEYCRKCESDAGASAWRYSAPDVNCARLGRGRYS
jgi:hypothetical protein